MTAFVGASLLLIPLGLWGTPRFHAPVIPFIVLFAAVGITRVLGILMGSPLDVTTSVARRETTGTSTVDRTAGSTAS